MSHRANLILIKKNNSRIYFSKKAQNIGVILNKGLKSCIEIFENCSEDNYLMDNDSAEGGLLIDITNKKILFFDCETFESIRLINLYIRHQINNNWKGWEIKWSFTGNIELAKYMNIENNFISSSKCTKPLYKYENLKKLEYDCEEEYAFKTFITIIKDNNIIDLFVLGYGETINFFISQGLDLINNIPENFIITNYNKVKEIEIEDILLVDYNNKKVITSRIYELNNIYLESIRKTWKDWECVFQYEGISFNFNYMNRERKYIEINKDDFSKFMNKKINKNYR